MTFIDFLIAVMVNGFLGVVIYLLLSGISVFEEDSYIIQAVCFLIKAILVSFGLFLSVAWWQHVLTYCNETNLDKTIVEETVMEATENTDLAENTDLLENTTGTQMETLNNIDVYYTKSYNTELFADGTDYYLLVCVPNGDYTYKLNNKEYLDIISGEFPESYVVAMSMNNTPDVFIDDTIMSLYPVVGKG